ncbi:very-long-chain 3-oxoacyl-CoA reductase 1-like [Oryza brachyantha]|uniref:very-long-chain 3-oxoacyl-CoA reductase 1-like n=1 Tax=Oryza brachyantha TaxID=4533 RepID=UPI001ADA6ABC|nr:very-long-chain 3-oxoacyl-CoA reductase 1-like [Oryza brachyantha]
MAVPIWFILLATLGAVHVAAAVFRLIAVLSSGLRRPKDLRRRYGEWAVVTGPTSGIGRAMALELAARGLDVVLVGRDRAKLREVADAVTRSHGVRTKTVVFDFSLVSTVQGEKAMAALREAVEEVDVGVLVNNAGVVKPGAMFLHEADVEAWVRMIRVNDLALTKVTAAVLPGMVERRRGAVVNIGSASSSVLPSFPLYSVYVGTKAYVAEFSRGLSVEYKSKGIDVQCQVPFLVDTKMISAAVRGKYVPLVVTAEEYARAAARSIGDGRRVCVPNTAHRLQQLLLRCTPEFAVDWCLLRLHLHHRAVFRAIRSSSGRRYSSTHRTPDGGQPATN